jgi:Putative beta barrel porin-7 (BBP7)
VLPGATTSALNTGDFGFDWKAGPDLTLGYRPTPKDAWEITYFGLLDWHDIESRTTAAADLSLPGALGGTLFFNGADTVVTSYTSRINDAEINYFWKPEPWSNWMFLAGMRYFNVDERFDTLAESLGNGSSFYNIHTINNLWGAQTGARYRIDRVHWSWMVDGKAGVYGNNATQRQVVGVSGGALTRDAGQNEDNWAFVGQLDATITYHLGKYWEAMAGYNVLWVDGLALAPDQLDFTSTPASGTSLNHNGSLFMHGVHAGVACRW